MHTHLCARLSDSAGSHHRRIRGRIVVDLPARLLARRFTEGLGRPFVVENRGGAGGNLAAEMVARGPKDGHTLLLATNGVANAAAMGASYDPVKDFAPIIAIATGPQMLVARRSLQVDNLQS